MKKLGLIFISLGFAVLSVGCATHEDTGTLVGAGTGALIGNQFGRGGGRVAATVAGAVVGGFVGNRIGASMDEEDRRRAADAQYTAFENGNRAEWRSPNGHYGYIEPRAGLLLQRHDVPGVLSNRLRRRQAGNNDRKGLQRIRWPMA